MKPTGSKSPPSGASVTRWLALWIPEIRLSLGMGRDLRFQLRELTVELVDRQIKGGALLAAGLVGPQVGQPVTHQMQRDLDDLQGLPSLLQVAVELNLGPPDPVEMVCERGYLVGGIDAKRRSDRVRPVVDVHFDTDRIVHRRIWGQGRFARLAAERVEPVACQ